MICLKYLCFRRQWSAPAAVNIHSVAKAWHCFYRAKRQLPSAHGTSRQIHATSVNQNRLIGDVRASAPLWQEGRGELARERGLQVQRAQRRPLFEAMAPRINHVGG